MVAPVSVSREPHSHEELLRLITVDDPTFLFFWGHEPRVPSVVDRACLSQWFPSTFTIDGKTFASAEHYMMYQKALMFDDHETAESIIAARHPSAAKRLENVQSPSEMLPSS